LAIMGIAPVVINICLRVETNGLGVVGNGLVVFFFALVSKSAIHQSMVEFGIELDGRAKVRDGLIVILFSIIGITPIVESLSIGGFGLDDNAEQSDGLVVILLLQCLKSLLKIVAVRDGESWGETKGDQHG